VVRATSFGTDLGWDVFMSEIFVPSVWRERLEALGGRRRDSLLIVGAVTVMVGGGLGLWTRGAPASIAPPARATPSPGSSTTAPAEIIVVHVAGAVRHPGIIELPPGARVADAIALAGGALPRADLDLLNLAAVVVDGSQVLVPTKTSSSSSVPAPVTSSAPATVNLNSADQTTLESVPGLGPVKAGAIVAYRTEIGGFTSIDQLLEVSGIGPATLESIRPFISL
jgi:competence protein ComEA